MTKEEIIEFLMEELKVYITAEKLRNMVTVEVEIRLYGEIIDRDVTSFDLPSVL